MFLQSRHEVYLCDYYGNRIDCFEEFASLEYNQVLDGVGELKIVVPPKYDAHLLKIGQQIQVERAPTTYPLAPKCVYLVDGLRQQEDSRGNKFVTISASHPNTMLGWRVGLYDVLQTEYNMPGDDLIKKMVRESLYSPADATRSVASIYNLTVEPDFSLGPSYLSKISTNDIVSQVEAIRKAMAADINQYFLHWEIVPTGDREMEFRTYQTCRYRDRRKDSLSPIVLSVESNTLSEPEYELRTNKEITHVYVQAKYNGEDYYTGYQDIDRITLHPAARHEKWVTASSEAAQGPVTGGVTLDAVSKPVALKELRNGLPVNRITGKFNESLAITWDIDVTYGDAVTIEFWDKYQDVHVSSVAYTVNSKGETVQATLQPFSVIAT